MGTTADSWARPTRNRLAGALLGAALCKAGNFNEPGQAVPHGRRSAAPAMAALAAAKATVDGTRDSVPGRVGLGPRVLPARGISDLGREAAARRHPTAGRRRSERARRGSAGWTPR